MPRRRVAILGSTGSIGTQALRVIDALNADGGAFEVVALVACRSGEALLSQARRHQPRFVALTDDAAAGEFRGRLAATGATALGGASALVEVASHPDVDLVLHGVVGAAGLAASFAAAGAGKTLCLANKESLVVGGTLLTDVAARNNATILPVDSEHSAVFQAMRCGRREEIDRVILTASGGPFRTWPADRIRDATVADAMNHPTWDMGGKITVDSATMFNKALEIIEAVHLFALPVRKIGVVVHPQSVVHSMVEFRDGSTIAHLSPPDMRTPIGYALTYPDRGRPGGRRMDWTAPQSLHFEPPDAARFPALRLADEALAGGASACVALNAANEVAVGAFLGGRLKFGQIAEVVEAAMRRTSAGELHTLDDLLAADAAARWVAEGCAGGFLP